MRNVHTHQAVVLVLAERAVIAGYDQDITPEIHLVAKIVQSSVPAQLVEATRWRSRPEHDIIYAVYLLRAPVNHVDVLDAKLDLLVVAFPRCSMLGYLIKCKRLCLNDYL